MKLLTALYAAVAFLSAFLLFLIEPIAARQLLPLFGGSAAVWTACLVFFQCALLVGYCYAHGLVTRLGRSTQTVVHIALLIGALLSFLTPIDAEPAGVSGHPVTMILWLLCVRIGPPFLALAATTPLLQAWYLSAVQRKSPPWWIFALSNAGSLLALLAYPTLVEPAVGVSRQVTEWRFAFVVFAVLCGWLAATRRGEQAQVEPVRVDRHLGATAILWVLLPACASMLLSAVTNHLGQNIAAIPLLWIVPLAFYLLSYVIAFASPRAWPRFLSVRMLALTLATFAYLLYSSQMALPLAVSIPVYTLALFFACLFCHAELYRLRPGGEAITRYYLLASLGSALGAIFVGAAAPALFHANYDLALAVVLLAVSALAATWRSGLVSRAVWSAAAVGLIYVALVQARAMGEGALVQLRSFYGSLRVTETHLPPEAETTRTLYHGRIQHGTQLFGEGLRTEPSSYYGRHSGVGLALDLCCTGRPKRVGVVGLGTGSVAAYGKTGDEVTFYEIDPLVERLARALFTYLRDSPAKIRVVLGDARLSMAGETRDMPRAARDPEMSAPAGQSAADRYDVLVLDAFSGDAVPVHLLTAEAISLYRQRLRPEGALLFHISSQYLDLAPELALQARHAGLEAVLIHSDADEAHGLFRADWILVSNNRELLARPEIASVAQPLEQLSGLRLWTDDYSTLLPLLKWRGEPATARRP